MRGFWTNHTAKWGKFNQSNPDYFWHSTENSSELFFNQLTLCKFHSPIYFCSRHFHQASKNRINSSITLLIKENWIAKIPHLDRQVLCLWIFVTYVFKAILSKTSELFLHQTVAKAVCSRWEGLGHLGVDILAIAFKIICPSFQIQIKVSSLEAHGNQTKRSINLI